MRHSFFAYLIRPACVIAIGCSLAAATLAADPRIERFDNGLRVVVIEDHSLPLVSVSLWYGVGSTADSPTQAGLTHIARAALEQREQLDLKARIAGIRFYSRTQRDACLFQSIGPTALVPYILDLEAARLRPYAISDKKTLSDARNYALIQSQNQRTLENEFLAHPTVGRIDPLSAATRDAIPLDEPTAQRLLTSLFDGHPYSRPPMFVADRLADVDRATLNEHLAQWFVPANATLIIQGDVEPIVALEGVRQRCEELAWCDVPRLASRDRPKIETLRIAARGDTKGLAIAWWLPGWVLPENVGAHALLHRLCNPVDGPLAARLTAAGCDPPRWDILNFREAGAAVLFIPFSERLSIQPTVEAIEGLVREELLAASNASADVAALHRAKALAMHDLQVTREGLRTRARLFGAYDQIAGDLFLAEFDQRRIERLTPAAMRAAAEHLIETRTVVMRVSRGSPDHSPSAPQAAKPGSEWTPAWRKTDAAEYGIARLHDTKPSALPARQRREVNAFTTLDLVTIPGLATTSVMTLLPASVAPRVVLEAAVARENGPCSQSRLRDLLSYRRWTLRIVRTEASVGLSSEGPSQDWPQLIELHAELVRPLAEITPPADAMKKLLARRSAESDDEYADRLTILVADLTASASPTSRPTTEPSAISARCVVVCDAPVARVAETVAAYWHSAPALGDPALNWEFSTIANAQTYLASARDQGAIRVLSASCDATAGVPEYFAAFAGSNLPNDWLQFPCDALQPGFASGLDPNRLIIRLPANTWDERWANEKGLDWLWGTTSAYSEAEKNAAQFGVPMSRASIVESPAMLAMRATICGERPIFCADEVSLRLSSFLGPIKFVRIGDVASLEDKEKKNQRPYCILD
ncbi:MAG: insulinase family protein [Phycisphaerales bacterium]|nr:insulinase family protein [Phycisphaerales bacterium]